jgi:hypothetical protein
MRPACSLLFLLLLSSNVTAAAPAQQAPARVRTAPRTWSQEMRDKAEASLYQRHDCRTALLQANAAFDRDMRHPDRMDPRIPLVKARAHECLGELPPAVLGYAMHDRLAAVAPGEDVELAGACSALLPAGVPTDSSARARLTDSLTVIRGQIAEARSRSSAEMTLRTGSGVSVPPSRPIQVPVEMDQGLITRDMGNEYIRVMRSAWYDAPYVSPGSGYERNARVRAGDAESRLSGALADVEARLLCLDPTR